MNKTKVILTSPKNISKVPAPFVEHRLYILMRNDLPSLNSGKAMAQAAHAGSHFAGKYGRMPGFNDWCDLGHFGTTIVLATNKLTIFDVIKEALENHFYADYIYDPTYPYVTNKELAGLIREETHTAPAFYKDNGEVICFRNELTCGYAFLPKDDSITLRLVGKLPLHP